MKIRIIAVLTLLCSVCHAADEQVVFWDGVQMFVRSGGITNPMASGGGDVYLSHTNNFTAPTNYVKTIISSNSITIISNLTVQGSANLQASGSVFSASSGYSTNSGYATSAGTATTATSATSATTAATATNALQLGSIAASSYLTNNDARAQTMGNTSVSNSTRVAGIAGSSGQTNQPLVCNGSAFAFGSTCFPTADQSGTFDFATGSGISSNLGPIVADGAWHTIAFTNKLPSGCKGFLLRGLLQASAVNCRLILRPSYVSTGSDIQFKLRTVSSNQVHDAVGMLISTNQTFSYLCDTTATVVGLTVVGGVY